MKVAFKIGDEYIKYPHFICGRYISSVTMTKDLQDAYVCPKVQMGKGQIMAVGIEYYEERKGVKVEVIDILLLEVCVNDETT